jgi:uncharacterized protein (DUF1778 family)
MLAYETDLSIQGQKTARMEQRTTRQAKELIEQAASLLGVNASEFMVSVAAKAAREILRDHEQTRLTAPAHQEFMRALDATEPPAKLVALMKMHKEASGQK